MTSYPFIQDLFTNILKKSKAIQGRFHVSSKGGIEINSDTVGEVLNDEVKLKKYPLCLMMPPRSSGNYSNTMDEWEDNRFTMFFLKTTYYDSNNQVSNINQKTQTSQHTILQDWHDMKRCAVSFIRVLSEVQRKRGLINTAFRMSGSDKHITPVSMIGVDRVSGVRLDFSASLLIGCALEDYSQKDISLITIPVMDSHPEHQL